MRAVNNVSEDPGFTTTQLWSVAWLLGLVALAAIVRLGLYAADGTPVQSEHFAWMSVCVIAAVFSGSCTVLAGVKLAEARVLQQMRQMESRGA